MAYKQLSPIPVVEGGLGAQTVTNHGVVLGQGTSAVVAVSPSATAGQALVSAGAAADPAYGTVVVAGGGTGDVSFTAYSVVTGGTTSTGALQNVSGVGAANQVLTSNGAGQLPTWQDPVSSPVFAVTLIDDGDSPYTVQASDQFISVDSSGGTVDVLLPDAPSTGKYFIIKDATGSAATNAITVTTVSGVINVDAGTTFVMNTNYESIEAIFDGVNYLVF